MTAEAQTGLDDAAAVFTGVRRTLFGIAYRMLGSVTEAEDVVQDAWLRWQTTDRSSIRNPDAFLTTVTTRLAINVLDSARHRRETYIGPWLPEPVDTSADPTLGAERAEALDLAMLTLLERLTPVERAAYVLREAFDYGYGDIARIVQVSEPAARQLVSRARKHVAAERHRPVAAEAKRSLLDAFLAAARLGDVDGLEKLFAAEVLSRTDTDGTVRNAAKVPIVGAHKVAKVLHAFVQSGGFWPGLVEVPLEVNGGPAAGLLRDGELIGVLSVTGGDDGIEQILWQMNAAKLEPLRRRVA